MAGVLGGACLSIDPAWAAQQTDATHRPQHAHASVADAHAKSRASAHRPAAASNSRSKHAAATVSAASGKHAAATKHDEAAHAATHAASRHAPPGHDAAKRDVAKRDSAKRDSAKRDPARSVAKAPDASARAAAQRERAERQSASDAASREARRQAAAPPASPVVPSIPAVPPTAAAKVPSGTLSVHDAVSVCLSSLNQGVRQNKRFDRLIQLDRYVIRARVRHDDAIFSEGQPVRVDTVVVIQGSARKRGNWQWQPVVTRCGLQNGRVVATSIEPRTSATAPAPAPALPPGEQRERRPGVNYVLAPSLAMAG